MMNTNLNEALMSQSEYVKASCPNCRIRGSEPYATFYDINGRWGLVEGRFPHHLLISGHLLGQLLKTKSKYAYYEDTLLVFNLENAYARYYKERGLRNGVVLFRLLLGYPKPPIPHGESSAMADPMPEGLTWEEEQEIIGERMSRGD